MAGAAVAAEGGVWEAPGHQVRIEYSSTVLDQIRIAAVDAYHLVPHGGVEIGGILFGERRNGTVRILAWRPIACEYARGPSFVLSKKDEDALQEALGSYRADTGLASLEPVGWVHSHTRSEILLSDGDLELYNRFFPQAWQVAMVVRPASFAPTRAGFFFREPDGSVHAQSSYLEFLLNGGNVPVEVPGAEPPGEVVSPAPLPAGAEPALPREEPLPPADEGVTEPAAVMTRPKRGRWVWHALGLVAVAAAMAAAVWQWETARHRLALSTSDAGGQLHISWNRSAIPVRDATGGTVEIQDGALHTEVHLNPADLRTGSISYARQSGDVAVRLIVQPAGMPPVEEVARFLKPGASKAASAGALPPPQPQPRANPDKEALEREAEAMRARIDQQKSELSRLEKMVGTIHESRLAAKPRTAKPPAPSVAAAPSGQPERKQAAQLPPAPVQAVQQRTQESMPQPVVHSEQPQRTAAAAPPPAPAAAPAPAPAKVAPQPSGGSFIWTGRFPKNGRLVIEGSRASFGAVSGSLPSVRSKVAAYPGDLTSQGITLFTPELKYARPVIEPPGARNGWNRTTYTWEPKRASGIRVVEQPSAQNGYRLVLQSDTSKISVILMEWQAVE